MSRVTEDVVRSMRFFVASPGGVDAERKAVREIADELNLPLRRHGWEIDVLRWEDRGPTSGRAQADINTDVARCDVFVGILWNRWGTPTGEHTSGFEEEWALARDRYVRSGAPSLWLYFKQLPQRADHEDPQVAQVRAFRREVEASEIAFYKTFADADDFTTLLRIRVLDEILRRSGLTRTDIGGVAIDWSAAYEQEPVWLVPQGRDRQTLAEELREARPGDAATLLTELADDVESHGFTDHAENLRIQACRALLAADRPHAALGLIRAILADHAWSMRFDEIDHLLRSVGDDLPPEVAPEIRGWRACSRAAEDPALAAADLADALSSDHAIGLDENTAAHWRAIYWRCLLHERQAETIANDPFVPDPAANDVHLELALLRGDALRAARRSEADAAWQQLRLLAHEQATSAPANAAWIATRAAHDLVAQEELAMAEAGYTDAATRWTTTAGGNELAALAFFAAQATAQLTRDWAFRGWGWRGLAAAQRSGTTSFARRAEELELRALHLRLADDHDEAIALLIAALWCHQRLGLLHGVMKDLSLLADAYRALGRHADAVAMYCRTADRKNAERTARRAVDPTAVVKRLSGRWPGWSLEARCAALAAVGRSAPADLAAELVPEIVAATGRPTGRFDNAPTVASDALAALTLGIEDDATQALAVRKLVTLSADEHYVLAKAGRYGLRVLCDIAAVDEVDLLITRFVADERIDEPDAMWIAEHLTTPARVAPVRVAALRGHSRALMSLIHADLIKGDPALLDYCSGRTEATLASDLGMTPDGSGMWGLMALDWTGAIAAATANARLQQATAEMLLMYALQTRWPMANRVSAVAGLDPLLEVGEDQSWLDELRPLACPEDDLDQEAQRPAGEMWANPGDLEAMALKVCARIAARSGSTTWLDDAILDAALDQREPLRTAAWHAAALRDEWFDDRGARHALVDDSPHVRIAALHAWRQRSATPMTTTALRRLASDPNIGVRLALISLMNQRPDRQLDGALCSDADGYVRGIARRELGGRAGSEKTRLG